MNMLALLRTPPPVHTFLPGGEQFLYGRLNGRRDALVQVEQTPLPEDWFRLGPVGLLQVDRQVLASALGVLLRRLEKPPQQASLVAPNAWMRSVVVETGDLPHQRDEAEQVVRWRLKKLLPCRPEDVRLDFLTGGENGRMLVVLALDRPLSAVEEVFSAAGVHLGRMEPAALALTALLPASAMPVLLAAVEEHALALVVLAGGKPVLLRHKPLPADAQRAEVFMTREITRTLAHAREQQGLTGPVVVWLASTDGERGTEVERWADGEPGVTVNRLAVGAGRVPLGSGVPDVRLWSLLGTAWAGEA
jgi:Tfp pilus assembly PilM family ATPase